MAAVVDVNEGFLSSQLIRLKIFCKFASNLTELFEAEVIVMLSISFTETFKSLLGLLSVVREPV